MSAGRGPVEQSVKPYTHREDFGVLAREPRPDPLRPVKERERRQPGAPDGHASHQPARVDEAHVVEPTPGRGHARGDRAELRDRRDGLGDAAEAERVGCATRRGRQRREQARIVRPEKTVSSTTASEAQSAHALELGGETRRPRC